MKQSEIEGIIEKRFEKINTAFDNVRMHLNEDDIRLFRVKVKKLAACLHQFQQEDKAKSPVLGTAQLISRKNVEVSNSGRSDLGLRNCPERAENKSSIFERR